MSNELRLFGALALGAAICSMALVSSCALRTPVAEDPDFPFRRSAVEVAVRVSEYSEMSRPCFNTAVGIVESGVAQRLARTEGELRHARLVAGVVQSEWERMACPVKALPGLAFGTSEVTRTYVLGAHTATIVH